MTGQVRTVATQPRLELHRRDAELDDLPACARAYRESSGLRHDARIASRAIATYSAGSIIAPLLRNASRAEVVPIALGFLQQPRQQTRDGRHLAVPARRANEAVIISGGAFSVAESEAPSRVLERRAALRQANLRKSQKRCRAVLKTDPRVASLMGKPRMNAVPPDAEVRYDDAQLSGPISPKTCDKARSQTDAYPCLFPPGRRSVQPHDRPIGDSENEPTQRGFLSGTSGNC